MFSRVFIALVIASGVACAPALFEGKVDLDPNFAVEWTTDMVDITFTITAKTRGWVGFGINPQGDMLGADLIMGGVVNIDSSSYFGDYYSEGFITPTLDASQDWTLLSATQDTTSTTLVVTRPWVTTDTEQDLPIESTITVIYAWGTGDTISYHGSNRGSAVLNLVG